VHATGVLSLARPRVMAVVNLTPDSFHDGGRLMVEEGDVPNVAVALRRCEQLVLAGADVLDIGGESTRPGATPVDASRELGRVLPLVEGLRRHASLREVPISIDTRHAEVARQALMAGAAIVNDVTGLADPAMADVVAQAGAGLVIGHLRGEPATMQNDVAFTDLFREVEDELVARVEVAVAAGCARERILVDPGIGFGKRYEHSAALVASGDRLRAATGCEVLIGASRKSFLASLTGGASDNGRGADRLVGSVVAAAIAVVHGAKVVRVHDVRETVEALSVALGITDAYGRLQSNARARS
jgi:dihydropteroate synthase